MISLLKKLFGSKSERDIRSIQPLVEQIKEAYTKLAHLTHDQLRAKTGEFRLRIQAALADIDNRISDAHAKASQEGLEIHQKTAFYDEIDRLNKERDKVLEGVLLNILPEAFAVMKDTARRFTENESLEVIATAFDRELATLKKNVVINGEKAIYYNTWTAAGAEVTWNMVHYDVQLIGGVVLHQGKIAEMATGEGKTLVGTLPAYLNALAGQGVHIVTVNDYLARRDAEWNGPLFEFHGLRVDCIDKHEPNSEQRRQAYQADITFGTNNEFGFDYLRDNMALAPESLVQRKLHFAMVDEVDSVLIDDARTPLIISGPVPYGDEHQFHDLKPRIERLVSAQKSVTAAILNQAKKLISEKKSGVEEGGLALLRAHRGLPKSKALIKFLSEAGIKQILAKAENYYLQDQGKEMPMVDEELYFVIDEKNNQVELTDKGIELITSSGEDPHFFVIPDMGTEIAELEKSALSSEEKIERKDALMRDFSIKSERIHSVNQLLKAYTLFERDVEYIVEEGRVKIVDEQTGRIMEGRRYSDGLHQAIEAKENVRVEEATQTYATVTLQNYFRMYHKLCGMTGTAITEAGEFWQIYKLDVVEIPTNLPTQRKDMEDLVYRTMREKYNAVTEEIINLTQGGRPVLVGTTSVEISELLSRMLKMRGIKHNVLNAKLHQKEADVVAEAGKAGTVTIATNMAGRGTDIKLGADVREAGGLAIIGTERHESRRVDRQLRGRAGRQGDPGSSQFFVSLEDNLMRLFGSDRIANIMVRMGIEEGEVIQHSMITKSIERAQRKVEENNFGVRKRLLEYDDVMNSQRTVVYAKRRNALSGERLDIDLDHTVFDVIEDIVAEYKEVANFEGFRLEIIRIFSVNSELTEHEFAMWKEPELVNVVFGEVKKFYQRKREALSERIFKGFKNLYQENGTYIDQIIVPFTDGVRNVQVPASLKKVMDTGGNEVFKAFERAGVLSLIDELWKEHLREMDELKQAVQNAVYEQKDPLIIYKIEAFELFKQMLARINKEIVAFLYRADVPLALTGFGGAQLGSAIENLNRLKASKAQYTQANGSRIGWDEAVSEVTKTQPVRIEQKIGRNDPCPCGSGKKYKNCHGG